MNLQKQKEHDLDCIEAEIERTEQIKNAEAAYKRGEVTADWLAWFRQFTAKAITVIDLRPQADRITK